MKRRIGSFGLAVIMLIMPILLLQLAGCGKDTGETKETSVVEQIDNEYTYKAEFRQLAVDGYFIGSAIIGKDERVYFNANKEGEFGLFVLRLGEDAPERLPADLGKKQYISAMGTDAEGNLVLGLIEYKDTDQGTGEQEAAGEESASQAEQIEVRTLAADGSTLHSADVTNVFNNKKDLFIQSILADEKGNYYVCANQQVYVINPSGEVLCEVSADVYISSLFQIKDGRVLAGYYENNSWKLKEVNIERKALTEIESKISFEYGTYQSGTDTDLIYTQGTILYTCNLEDEKPVQILNWVNNDVDGSKLNDFRILEDGRVVALSRDWSSEDFDAELIILTRRSGDEKEEEKEEEKIILTYGATYLSYYTNEDIVAFNKQSDKYRIEAKQYGDDTMNIDESLALMAADISSGKGPDMLDMAFGFSLEEYLNMGILEDLNPYLEKNEELNREDYLENVIASYEREGKLYAIMPSFGLKTIIGKVSDVGTGSSWTIDEMIKLVESKPSDIEILPYTRKGSILNTMCLMSLDELVNEETGECNFTGDEFKKILEFANYFPKEVNYDSNQPSEIEKIRSGKLLLANTTITSVELYQMYEYMFGEEVNFIGYPTLKESGSTISPFGTTVGMNINSENKEGVWEFIHFLLTKEKQGKLTGNDGFPILKEALEVQFAKDMATDTYVDINGEEKEKQKMTWGDGTFSVDVKAATEEQVERVREMIENAEKPKGIGPNKMLEIIQEETQAYFEGVKSAEDTAAVIQNRVQIYINEKR